MNILQKVQNAIKYGFVLNVVIYRLRWLGIVICPYYWVQEGLDDVTLPELKGPLEEFTFKLFGPDEIEQIGEIPERRKEKRSLLIHLKEGKKCFGIKHRGEIVAFMWFSFHEGALKGLTFQLQEQEAYLFEMYTLEAYRGQNIAPHLRYKCYELLRQMGKDNPLELDLKGL